MDKSQKDSKNDHDTTNISQEEAMLTLAQSKTQERIIIEPTEEMKEVDISQNQFDERFKNRKSRREFMKLINKSRIAKSTAIKVNKNTGKRFKKHYTETRKKDGKVEPKVKWSMMPKFTHEMSMQYSVNCGFIPGWRSKNLVQISKKDNFA